MAKLLKGKKKHSDDDDEISEKKGSGNKWFSKGFDGIKEDRSKQEENKKSYTNDFWILDGQKTVLRFVSSESLNIWQHRVKNGRFFQNVTCLNPDNNPEMDECPLCSAGINKQYVGVFIVIERNREWTGKKDHKTHSEVNQIKIWRAGRRVLSALDEVIEERGKITGFDIKVKRKGAGTDTMYYLYPRDEKTPLGLDDDKKALLEAMDLEEMLAPLSRKKCLLLLGKGRTAESEESNTSSRDTDDDDEDDDDDNDVLDKF